MNSSISRPSDAKPVSIGRGHAVNPFPVRKVRKHRTVALWDFAERNTTSPTLVTLVASPPARTISSLSFTYPSLHIRIWESRANRYEWGRWRSNQRPREYGVGGNGPGDRP